MKPNKIKIILPFRSRGAVEDYLVDLTEALVKSKKAEWVGGFLGGEFGYGCHFKNEVFEMHPEFWGECKCDDPTFTDNELWDKHLPDCPAGWPNFKHFKSGVEIKWYKYIGRDMQYNKKITAAQWTKIIRECFKSIK